ncbi:methyltransferase [Micromonospora sp. NPDC048830]|uniref:methyltransferase n=1 Tax=Micromonospora sp. NPDC048830 TaxID=3364257 RepID=UPI0037205FE0
MPETVVPVSRERLLSMMTAYKSTYLLRAALELKVFDSLAKGPADPDDVAAMLRTNPRGTRMLLRALAAAGLLRAEGEQFSLVDGAEELLVSTSPQYCGGIIQVAAGDAEWDTMRDLAGAVRHGGSLLETDAESPGYPYWVDFATHLTFAVRPSAEFVAEQILPWAASRESLDVLDVGCGHGLLGFTLAKGDPRATVTCLDWPEVLAVAETYADQLGVAERVRYLPGNAFDVLPDAQYDVILLGNFLFQFSARRCAELVRRLAARLRPGGRLVIVSFTTGDQPPEREFHAAMLNLLMLAWTSTGELHSTTVYRNMLAGAGLTGLETHDRPGLPLRYIAGRRA